MKIRNDGKGRVAVWRTGAGLVSLAPGESAEVPVKAEKDVRRQLARAFSPLAEVTEDAEDAKAAKAAKAATKDAKDAPKAAPKDAPKAAPGPLTQEQLSKMTPAELAALGKA